MARILLVDDDVAVRRVFAKILAAAGHEVAEAEDGRRALDALAQQAADLIITDVYMPGTDGIEALIRLRHEFPDARVIVMSGGGHRTTEDILAVARRLGAQRTLAKPTSREELLQAVDAVLADLSG